MMIASILMAAAAAIASPAPAKLRTFSDWIMGCDNSLHCEAVALMPEEGAAGENYLFISIERDAAGDAEPRLVIPLYDVPDGSHATLVIDGQTARQISLHGDQTASLIIDRPLATALAKGQQAALVADGKMVSQASLKGLAAALLHMDDRQNRLGTQGALLRVGSRPSSDVPPPPPLPVILSPAAGTRPPTAYPDARARHLVDPEAVSCERAEAFPPERHRLDPAHTGLLIRTPCWDGAYNAFAEIFVINERGHAAPAIFDFAPAGGDERAHTLVNAQWDEKDHRLSEFVKGRGVGDCGRTGEYVWDGSHFRLVSASAMSECRGATHYIPVWHARAEPAHGPREN